VLPVDEITCRQFVELITDYFEDALEPRTLDQVEEHLVMCDWCVTYLEHTRATIDALGQLRAAPAPAEPAAQLLVALASRRGTAS
jgi:anti-sigma factor RsiW